MPSLEYRKARIRQGLCPVCGDNNDRAPKYMCSVCLEKENERKKDWAHRRIQAGKCPYCQNKVIPGKPYCEKCKTRTIERNKVYRQKQRKKVS